MHNVCKVVISIHAPTRGATKNGKALLLTDDISIHAPTRGATQLYREDFERAIISIHAPTRGATHSRMITSRVFLISIHAPTRGATATDNDEIAIVEIISIHAPTRGATKGLNNLKPQFTISIHAPTRGATSIYEKLVDIAIFQSTLPREERRINRLTLTQHLLHFNPRSHERSDCGVIDNWRLNKISIHAPTRGATKALKTYAILLVFQSTLPREERLL